MLLSKQPYLTIRGKNSNLDSQISFLNLQLVLYNQISGPYCYTSSATKMATAVLPLLKGLIAINSEVL